jgi:hypothetical protein
MNDVLKGVLYFLIGGLIVSVSSYWGARGRGFLAAFASTFPAMTGVTFILIYLNAGHGATISYARHLLWFVPPWIAYVGFIILFLPRFGFWPAMVVGLMIYMAMVALIKITVS